MVKIHGSPCPYSMQITEIKEDAKVKEATETNRGIADSELKNQSDAFLINEVKNENGDAFRILAERYNYIISYNISKLYSSFEFMALRTDKEDLFQECRIVLYKAAKCYDSGRAAKFSTYANICIKNYLITLCRKYGKTEKHSGYDFVPLEEIREDESGIYDRYFVFNDFPSFLEKLKTVEPPETVAFFDSLTSFEKNVFTMYMENRSYKHMADVLKKSVKSIDNAVRRVKTKLKPYAEYFDSEY